MPNIQIFCLFIALALTTTHGISQPEPGMPSEPPKCYAKFLTPDTLELSIYLLHVDSTIHLNDNAYGQTINQVFIDNYFANPNNYLNLINTAENKKIRPGGSEIWKEVPCNDETIKSSLITEVQLNLNSKGYSIDFPFTAMLDSKTQSALKQYQLENQLPVGNLNKETLNSLGIEEYKKPDSLKYKNNSNFDTICVYTQYSVKVVSPESLDFESTVYTGIKIKKLEFVDYIDLSPISPMDYNAENPRHAVVLNNKYDKLFNKSPNDFFSRENSVNYDSVIVEGGVVPYDCLCPDHSNITTIQADVEKALVGKGFPVDNTFSEITKRSLAQFQLKHNRPIGVLDFETLDLLGVEY